MRLFPLLLLLLLTSCTATDQQKIVKIITNKDVEGAAKEFVDQKKKSYQKQPEQLIRDVKSLHLLLANLRDNIESIWGKEETELPTNKRYVKYTNEYKARAIVDFTSGTLRVETIDTQSPQESLKQAIVTTLLATANPQDTDIFSASSPKASGTPFLYQQVLDQDKKPIAYAWRANRFADYLITHKQQKQNLNKQLTHFVEVPLVEKHQHLRQQEYSQYVLAAAKRYQIEPSLIYGVIEVESSFNPFAVSHANAYGLMQVVPSTAGKDVYEKVKNKPGQPSKNTLFDPAQNIDIGTAYLSMLSTRYLASISNSQSRHYSVISAYNGGAGNVLKTFSNNRKYATDKINQLSSAQVYTKLTKQHPREESRRYLYKVNKAEKKYR